MPTEKSGAHPPEPSKGRAKLAADPNLHDNWIRQNTCSPNAQNAQIDCSLAGSKEMSDQLHCQDPIHPAQSSPSLHDGISTGEASAHPTIYTQAEQQDASLEDQLHLALTDTLETAKSAPSLPFEEALRHLDETCKELSRKTENATSSVSGQQNGIHHLDTSIYGQNTPVKWAPQAPGTNYAMQKQQHAPIHSISKPARNNFLQRNPGMALVAAILAFLAIASGYTITNGVASTLKEVNNSWPLNQTAFLTSWFTQNKPTAEPQFSESIRFAKLVAGVSSEPKIKTDFDPEIVLARMSPAEPPIELQDHEYVRAKQQELSSKKSAHSSLQAEKVTHHLPKTEIGLKPAFQFTPEKDQPLSSVEQEKNTDAPDKMAVAWDKVDSDMIAEVTPEEPGNATNLSPTAELEKPTPVGAGNANIGMNVTEIRRAIGEVRGLDLLQQVQREVLVAKLSQGECLVPILSDYFVKVPVVTMRDLVQRVNVNC